MGNKTFPHPPNVHLGVSCLWETLLILVGLVGGKGEPKSISGDEEKTGQEQCENEETAQPQQASGLHPSMAMGTNVPQAVYPNKSNRRKEKHLTEAPGQRPGLEALLSLHLSLFRGRRDAFPLPDKAGAFDTKPIFSACFGTSRASKSTSQKPTALVEAEFWNGAKLA